MKGYPGKVYGINRLWRPIVLKTALTTVGILGMCLSTHTCVRLLSIIAQVS